VPAESAGAIHRLVLRNGLFGVGARAVTLVVGLVMTPYLLDRLGSDRFAIWALASVVTGSLGLLDFGIRRALIKHVAGALASGHREHLSSLLSSALALHVALAAVLGVVTMPLIPLAIRVLDIPMPLQSEARTVFAIVVLSLLVGTALTAFPALCDGMQRMDVTNSLGVLWLFLGAGATVVAVERGYGLSGVAAVQLASIAGFHLSTVPASRWLLGSMPLSAREIRRDVVVSLLAFGWKVHASSLAAVVARHLDKLLLSRWVSLAFVTSYELGLKLSGNAATLTEYLVAGLLPAASHLAASTERRDLSQDYERALRFLVTIGLPLFVFIFLEADHLLLAWLGAERPLVATGFARILAVGYAFAAIGGAMSLVCQGLGAPETVLRFAVLQLVLNVGASIALLLWIGPFGAALGTSIAFAVSAAYLTRQLHHLLATPIRSVTQAFVWPACAVAVAALAANYAGNRFAPPVDRWTALEGLAIEGLVFVLAYSLVWRVGKRSLG
jgi:O-antigen/teichoic acid export membrane protein